MNADVRPTGKPIARQDSFIEVIQSRQTLGSRMLPLVGAIELYENGGIAAVIIDRVSEDATAMGWRCEGDETGLIEDEGSRLDVQPRFSDGLRLARLTGAAALVVLCEDGPTLEVPLNEERIGRIRGLVPVASDELSPWPTTYDDPSLPGYGDPTGYKVTPSNGVGKPYDIHETRLIRIPGDPMPRRRLHLGPVPWMGRPVLEGDVANDIRRYRQGLEWTLKLLERKQQAVHKLNGLAESLETEEGKEVVRHRMDVADAVRNVLNSLTVDADDDYTITDLSLTGVADAMREFKIALSASSGMPVAILFGESAKGMDATGWGDLSGYFGKVGQVQNRCVRPGLERLMTLMWRQDALRNKEPRRWHVEFEPLWVETSQQRAEKEKAEAETRKTNAEAIEIINNIGVAAPEEMREAVQQIIPEMSLVGDLPELVDDPAPAEPPSPEIEPGSDNGAA